MESKICRCSKCHKHFEFSELRQKTQNLYGITTKISVCPYCGSQEWSCDQDRIFKKK